MTFKKLGARSNIQLRENRLFLYIQIKLSFKFGAIMNLLKNTTNWTRSNLFEGLDIQEMKF